MKVGVVGLGAMGAPMAVNLYQAGFLESIWNRTQSRAIPVTRETGVKPAKSLDALAASCDVIIISVSTDDDLREVIDAMMSGFQAETIVVDTSTVSATTAQHMAAGLEKKQVHFLDAPVSGGVEGAKKGALSMMVGGDETTLEQARPALEALSSRVVYMGPVGNGQATKAVNQIMAAGINQAVTEALAFGKAMNLPMDKVIEVVGSGAAGNWFVNHRGRTMLDASFKPGFRVALHDKDLAICLAMAEKKQLALPISALTREHYQRLMSEGYADEDISALYRLKDVEAAG